jgi:2-oxoglutarate ferredoxin oxidoreductase subunit alpha
LFGDDDGELLIVGWGSTKGAIEEAVARVRAEGHKVSSLHLTFLQPMASGIKEVLQRFKHVMTVENDWCDDLDDELIDEHNRRYSTLAWLLRARYLVDADSWCEVKGQPMKPGSIAQMIREKLH